MHVALASSFNNQNEGEGERETEGPKERQIPREPDTEKKKGFPTCPLMWFLL
jgi:hypothetical protein